MTLLWKEKHARTTGAIKNPSVDEEAFGISVRQMVRGPRSGCGGYLQGKLSWLGRKAHLDATLPATALTCSLEQAVTLLEAQSRAGTRLKFFFLIIFIWPDYYI